MRVLHVPEAVGGHPQGLSRAEREVGIDSVSVAFTESPFGYVADKTLRPAGTGRARYEVRRLALLARAFRSFDVIHFNFGRSMLPWRFAYRELPLLRRAGKVIAVTFQGDDARRGDIAPPWPSLPAALPDRYDAASDSERGLRVDAFAKHAHLIWYLNPDLARVLPSRAEFMAYAHVDLREWQPVGRGDSRPFTIVHAPSDRAVKGTTYLVEAVDRLRSEGLTIDLRLIEHASQDTVRAAIGEADVAVDQLFAGWYGGFAVEAMALGVPVVSYIRDSDLRAVPQELAAELPVRLCFARRAHGRTPRAASGDAGSAACGARRVASIRRALARPAGDRGGRSCELPLHPDRRVEHPCVGGQLELQDPR